MGKREGDGNVVEENQYLKKNWGGEEYKVVGNFIHPSFQGTEERVEEVSRIHTGTDWVARQGCMLIIF